MDIHLTLPYPPSVNHYWGQSGKRRFIGKKGKEFRARVVEIVFVQERDVKEVETELLSLALEKLTEAESRSEFDLSEVVSIVSQLDMSKFIGTVGGALTKELEPFRAFLRDG
jgi:hypothetical protein